MNHGVPKRIYVATFLLAGSVLLLEIAMTRVFSVLTWHHFTYMIISIALLGFGASGSYLTVKNREDRRVLEPGRIARNSFLFAATALVSLLIATRIQFEPLSVAQDWQQVVSLFLFYFVLVVPFFFAGLALGTIITVHSKDIHRVYFSDLFGASIGSLVSVFCIQYLGATNTVLLVSFVASVAALLLSQAEPKIRSASFAGVLFFGAVLAAGIHFDPYMVFAPSSKGIFSHANAWRGSEAIDFRDWHMVARVDVTHPLNRRAPTFSGNIDPGRVPVWEHRLIYQDGAAPTGILKSDGDVKKMTFLGNYLQAAPYVLREAPKVLVIGVGGGIDVLIALFHDAVHVTGAEVNPVTAKCIQETFSEYAGGIFNRPDVDIRAAEGRHFVSRSREQYDVIQLSGVDTFTALSSGAYALAENYLYSIEAMEDFWDHLSPHGILSFSRWIFSPPRETLRLTAMMVEAMENRGIQDPSRHIVIVKGTTWAETLLKRSPFTPAEVEALESWAKENTFSLLYHPFKNQNTEFDILHRASPDERSKFYDSYFYEIRPSTDDAPFFFNYYKWMNIFKTKASKHGFTTTNFPVALLTHAVSLIQILILAALGILYPMRKLRESVFDQPGGGRTLAYFSALGLGFIFAEISLIQKLMVFLGGPTYSLSITLFAILLFSGLGSFAAKRFEKYSQRLFSLLPLLLLVLIVGVSQLFDYFIPKWLGYSLTLRILLTILLIAPMAFVMGMPFPLGIRALRRTRPEWIPWAWATNSFMTVFGPLFCIFLSMHMGFDLVFVLAASIYLGGFLLFRPLATAVPAVAEVSTPAA